MVFKPVIAGRQMRYPSEPVYDADGILCEQLKELAPPLMLPHLGPLIMYEQVNGVGPEWPNE